MGPLGGLLGASWGFLGASRGRGLEMSVRVPRLGTLLEPSWGPLGPSWRPLGPSRSPLGQFCCSLGSLLGRLGAILRAFPAVLERERPNPFKNLRRNARTPNSFKHLGNIDACCVGGFPRAQVRHVRIRHPCSFFLIIFHAVSLWTILRHLSRTRVSALGVHVPKDFAFRDKKRGRPDCSLNVGESREAIFEQLCERQRGSKLEAGLP